MNKNLNKNKIYPSLFTKKINANYKLVPFNLSENNHTGETRYLPPVIKEWKNSVYNYNAKNTMNYPIYDLKVNSLIRGYFNMYFNHKFLEDKFISRKKKRVSYNKIYVSKAEIKHTNSKAIITIYIYNREKRILLHRIEKVKLALINLMKFAVVFYNKLDLKPESFGNWNIVKAIVWLSNKYDRNSSRKLSHKRLGKLPINRISSTLSELFSDIRKYRLKLSLNKYKSEEIFLYKLSKYMSKYYNKKVEFNIVNLKSITYNGDIFTEILTSKVRNDQNDPIWAIKSLLAKVKLPKENRIKERSRIPKSVNFELIGNKYRSLNISSILDSNNLENNLNNLLYNQYNKGLTSLENGNEENETGETSYLNIRDAVLRNVKYKNMAGAKVMVKGRLTKRYRADRALYKLRWKGGLKNIDSAFKGLPSVLHRGYLDSNVEKTVVSSKRRIGSFAVKGWFSGK